MHFLILIVALVMSGGAMPAVAGPLEDGAAAYEKGDYAGALTALTGSFIDPAADLNLGVYNSYGTASGDRTNP